MNKEKRKEMVISTVIMVLISILMIYFIDLVDVPKKKAEESIVASNSDAITADNSVGKMKEVYKYSNSVLSPVYNVNQQGNFSISFNTKEELPEDAVGVYTDIECSEKSKIDTVTFVEKNRDKQSLEINAYETLLSSNTNMGWGYAPVYYISIKYDTDSKELKKLEKPIVIPFKTQSSVETPVLKYTISENGIFKIKWEPISGVDAYRIYKIYTNDETAASVGYKNNPKLVAEVENSITEWCDWNTDKTNGMGTVNGEATIYENYGLSGEYYITAVKGERESKYSNAIIVNEYADILPLKINSESLLKPGEYIQNVKDLPRSTEVKTLNGDNIKYSVNYYIDETTRYKDNVYYNYKINGTELKGYIEVKVSDVTSLPSEVKNGITTYSDDYNIDFKVKQSNIEQEKMINLNNWIEKCKLTEEEANKQLILDDSKELVSVINASSCEEIYIASRLMQYTSEIDLSVFQNLQDYIKLEDKMLKICYQNPLITGVKELVYDEDTKILKVVYIEDKSVLKSKQSEIEKIISEQVEIINKDVGKDESIKKIEAIYKYINESFVYNKDSDLYEMVKNKTGNSVSYSQMFKMMCDEMGIECVVVSGSLNGYLHTWNAVRFEHKENNNEWYYIDNTNNLKNVGMQRMCYNMSTEYAKKIGYLSNSKFEEHTDEYTSISNEFEYYSVNDLVCTNENGYMQKVLEGIQSEKNVITVRYNGDEITSSKIVSGVSQIFKDSGNEKALSKLKFGEGMGYYVLWYE